MRLIIIGAGVAGLAAAHRLRTAAPQLEVVIYEKSRGVGGRVASRRFNGATFDHGAQYIKTPTPELRELLTKQLAHDTLHDINLPVWVFDQAGTIAPGDPKQNAGPKWSYEEGNTQLAKELARHLTIHFNQRVTHIAPDGDGWTVWSDDTELDRGDLVLLTPPAPQTAELLQASPLPADVQALLIAAVNQAVYRPCLTLTLGYPRRPRPRPYYALINTDKGHPISWLAFEHLKEGRKTADQGVYILQMSPSWSTAHWDDPADEVGLTAAELLTKLLDQPLRSPLWTNRQGWRYALPDGRADFETVNGALPGLLFAGDWTAGQGRVNLAIEEGWRVADRILTHWRSTRP